MQTLLYNIFMNSIIGQDLDYILSTDIPWTRLRNKTFLISGAAGFIASYIVRTLVKLNDQKHLNIKVIGIVRNKQKAKIKLADIIKIADFKLIIHDVCKPIIIREKIDIIIHAASLASPKYFNTNPVETLNANIFGTKNLLELAKEKKSDHFLFLSSGEVYGKLSKKQLPTNEKSYGYIDLLDVRSCYAESKRMGEAMSIAWNHQYKVPTKIVRLFHTYGPGISLDDGRVFADFAANIINNQNINLKSTGTAIRSFCYIADCVTGIFTVLFQGKNGDAYNIANDKGNTSIKNLAKLLVDIYPEKKLKVIIKKRKKNDPYLRSPIQINDPDISKIKSLGWKPKYPLQTGFKRIIDSYL